MLDNNSDYCHRRLTALLIEMSAVIDSDKHTEYQHNMNVSVLSAEGKADVGDKGARSLALAIK